MGSVELDRQEGRPPLLKLIAVAVVSAGILVFWSRRDPATTTREPETEPEAGFSSARQQGTKPDVLSKQEPSIAAADREPRATVPSETDPSVAAGEDPTAPTTTPEQAPARLSLPTCPERAPRDSSECSVSPDVEMNCGYQEGAEAMTCRCKGSGAGAMLWECRSDDEPSKLTLCPESLPADRTACDIAGQICFFGEAETARACECESETPHTWNCITAVEYAGRRH